MLGRNFGALAMEMIPTDGTWPGDHDVTILLGHEFPCGERLPDASTRIALGFQFFDLHVHGVHRNHLAHREQEAGLRANLSL